MGVARLRGLTSLSKSGESQLNGDVTLSEGSNITITQVGQDIEISAAGGEVGTDELVGVDAAAAPGYIGPDASSGVIRTSAPLSKTDGGDYVTLGININGLVNSGAAKADIVLIEDQSLSWAKRKITLANIFNLFFVYDSDYGCYLITN